jgi:hypothetical protein
MRTILFVAIASILFVSTGRAAFAGSPAPLPEQQASDSDHDGLSDDLEQRLLAQFIPTFMISRDDCSRAPASFTADLPAPLAEAENGTIYGQVFPAKLSDSANPAIEIHYYHLWKTDCGPKGHPLDAEHVSVLLHDNKQAPHSWRAAYWYAAAHEDTVCDTSQIARASTLHAEDHGPAVWISAGKHASFLDSRLCSRGCGGDACEQMIPLPVASIINLGEDGAPMNGASWAASPQWPLSTKMLRSDFQPSTVSRLERLPISDIAWVNPSKRPTQSTIAAGVSTMNALETSNRDTDSAIALAEDSTGNALSNSYRDVKRALGKSVRGVSDFLSPKPKP